MSNGKQKTRKTVEKALARPVHTTPVKPSKGSEGKALAKPIHPTPTKPIKGQKENPKK